MSDWRPCGPEGRLFCRAARFALALLVPRGARLPRADGAYIKEARGAALTFATVAILLCERQIQGSACNDNLLVVL